MNTTITLYMGNLEEKARPVIAEFVQKLAYENGYKWNEHLELLTKKDNYYFGYLNENYFVFYNKEKTIYFGRYFADGFHLTNLELDANKDLIKFISKIQSRKVIQMIHGVEVTIDEYGYTYDLKEMKDKIDAEAKSIQQKMFPESV